jgi:hypothetical protein
MRIVFSLAIATVLLSGCGYDGSFRYPCHAPDKWNQKANPECFPPDCEADGTCLKDIMPEEIYEQIKK